MPYYNIYESLYTGMIGSTLANTSIKRPANRPGPGPGDLLAELTAAAGTAPTALWIPGVETFKNNSLDPAEDGDGVYRMADLLGGGAHFEEFWAGVVPYLKLPRPEFETAIDNPGGHGTSDTVINVLDASGFQTGDLIWVGPLPSNTRREILEVVSVAGNAVTVARNWSGAGTTTIADEAPVYRYQLGTKPFLAFKRAIASQSPRLDCAVDLSNIITAGAGSIVALLNTCWLGLDRSTATEQSTLIGNNDNNLFPSWRMRDGTTATQQLSGLAAGSGAGVSPLPHMAPRCYVHSYDVAGDAVRFGEKGGSSASGLSDQVVADRNLTLGSSGTVFSHCPGLVGALATWNVALSDAQRNAVVDVLRAYAGLDPVADPE